MPQLLLTTSQVLLSRLAGHRIRFAYVVSHDARASSTLTAVSCSQFAEHDSSVGDISKFNFNSPSNKLWVSPISGTAEHAGVERLSYWLAVGYQPRCHWVHEARRLRNAPSRLAELHNVKLRLLVPYASLPHHHCSQRAFHLASWLRDKDPKSKVERSLELLKMELSRSEDSDKEEKAKLMVPQKSWGRRFVDELKHYYHGFKLLAMDIRVSTRLLWRLVRGNSLTRRERKQLVLTVSDLFRLLPFLVFIVIPFMEFLLPVYLKLFPGMLPSTFQEKPREDMKIRRSLKVRLEMAKFFQATLEEMSVMKTSAKASKDKPSLAKEFAQFIKEVRTEGKMPTNVELARFTPLFEDELTLDNLSVGQLRALCRIVNITPVGLPNFLRFQLQMKLRELKADDKLIQQEGLASLTAAELQEACRARGMRALGVSEQKLRSQLGQWLELSLDDRIPPTLLLLTRTLTFLPEDVSFSDRLSVILKSLPETAANEVKVKLTELEGSKIDNKAKLQIIQSIEAALKQEREEEKEKERLLHDEAMLKAAAEVAQAETDLSATAVPERAEAIFDRARELAPPAGGDALAAAKAGAPAFSFPAGTMMPISKIAAGADPLDAQELRELEEVIDSARYKDDPTLELKEDVDELKEDILEHKEDVETLQALTILKGEPLAASKAARRLESRVDRLIHKMDGLFDQLQSQKEQLKETSQAEAAKDKEKRKAALLTINELMLSLRKLKLVPDDMKEQRILEVLKALDKDADGAIDAEHALKVIELLARENVKLTSAQVQGVLGMLLKEAKAEDAKNAKATPANSPTASGPPLPPNSANPLRLEPTIPPPDLIPPPPTTGAGSSSEVPPPTR